MSHHRKTNHKKSSSSSSSSCSSENNLWQNIEQPLYRTSQSSSSSSGCSMKKPIYPNVPKRIRRSPLVNDHDTIETESRIEIIPSEIHLEKSNEYSSIRSSSNQNAYTRHTLDLITKYTSPQKKIQDESYHRPLSPVQSQITILSNSQPVYGSKSKRTLSPLYETNRQIHEPKRTKSFDEDDDDDLSQLIDHRQIKKISSQTSTTTISSQNSNTTISSQITIDGKQRKPTVRKPTARKLSATQPKPIASQPISTERFIENISMPSHETLVIEPDIDTEEENTIDREGTSWLFKRSKVSNTQHNHHIELEDHINHSISTPIIPSPIKLPIDNCIDSLNSNITQNNSFSSINIHTPIRSSRQIRENLIDHFSPCSNNGIGGGRRFSSTSSNSLFFETPNSSFSRTTTNNTTSTPQIVIKNDRETQIFLSSNIDMINQLISQMNKNENKINYNPTEVSKKFFHQCIPFSSNNKYPMNNLLIKKSLLNFGRYEIEILFPIDNNKNLIIYTCDICLKHFHGSSMAFQRHTAKCLYTQPPGKLVFSKDDLAIFEIGQTNMNMEQRIYVKSLCRIVRLFMDSNKNIDDTKIDRFTYYILCRRDPILSQSQSFIYRLIGYFSKRLNQHAQQLINNLSCLFILPPFAQDQQYNQLLIAFSYFLIRSNASTNLIYSSPDRPLDNLTLAAFRIYWRDILFAYIINHNHSSIKSLALDTFARQTSIHPRDILSSLYSNGFIVPHPTDKSSVYLLNNAYRMMTSLNLHTRNKFLFLDMNLINTDDDEKIMIDKQNIDKNHDSGIEEIVLD